MTAPDQLCAWCEQPIDLRDASQPEPTRIDIPSFGQVRLLHAVCGAQLLHAGMEHKPTRSRRSRPTAGTRAVRRRRLALVKEA